MLLGFMFYIIWFIEVVSTEPLGFELRFLVCVEVSNFLSPRSLIPSNEDIFGCVLSYNLEKQFLYFVI